MDESSCEETRLHDVVPIYRSNKKNKNRWASRMYVCTEQIGMCMQQIQNEENEVTTDNTCEME